MSVHKQSQSIDSLPRCEFLCKVCGQGTVVGKSRRVAQSDSGGRAEGTHKGYPYRNVIAALGGRPGGFAAVDGGFGAPLEAEDGEGFEDGFGEA